MASTGISAPTRNMPRIGGYPAVIAPNGTMLDLTGPQPVFAEKIETGRVYLDGTELIGALDGVVRDRSGWPLRGHVVVSILIDEGGQADRRRPGRDDRSARRAAAARRAGWGDRGGEIGRNLARAKRAPSLRTTTRWSSSRREPARCCNDLIGKKPPARS